MRLLRKKKGKQVKAKLKLYQKHLTNEQVSVLVRQVGVLLSRWKSGSEKGRHVLTWGHYGNSVFVREHANDPHNNF